MSDQLDIFISALEAAIGEQKVLLKQWERRSGAITLEIVRALDDVFCRELFDPTGAKSGTHRVERSIMGWGANNALLRCLPLEDGPPALQMFPTLEENQGQVDQFLFHCGTLQHGTRLFGWLREGLMTGRFRRHARAGLREMDVLVLKTADPSLMDEEIGRAGLRWSSNARIRNSRLLEKTIMKGHREVEASLDRDVWLQDGWLPIDGAPSAHEEYFLECGRYYLDRIGGRDLLGPEDCFADVPFSDHVKVLTALSARAHRRIMVAMSLRRRYPGVDLRCLLTTVITVDRLEGDLTRQSGLDLGVIRQILGSLTLSGDNLSTHTECEDIAWPPLIQTEAATRILPLFGLDINPFLFLFRDLRTRYPQDWFEAANARERRWIDELEALFATEALRTNPKCPKLKSDGRVITDIDYAVHDRRSNCLSLFQLKWQQPVGLDNRSRRSLGKNLVMECNKWVEAVSAYLADHGVSSMMHQLGFNATEPPTIQLIVVARYNAHFSGHSSRDRRATWASWDNLRKALQNAGRGFGPGTIRLLRRNEQEMRRRVRHESLAFPLGELTVMVNPTAEPAD